MITRRLYAFNDSRSTLTGIWRKLYMSRKVIDARADSKGNITHVKIEGNRRRGVTYAQLAEKLAQILEL